MEIVCFDMEGTLTPEIWEQVAKNTGIDEFNKTTRDIPSYGELMDFRLDIMSKHDLKLHDIQKAASELDLLPGAEDFINIANFCKHVFIEEIHIFNNENSNQQLSFITLIDIFYEKKIKLTLSIAESLHNLTSSNKHSEIFKRTLSRLFEMTKSP